nr:MAG TPA: hypothetical protein [Caudoviricetes sp.]
MPSNKTGILRVYKPSISLGRKKFKHNVRRTVLSTPQRDQKQVLWQLVFYHCPQT